MCQVSVKPERLVERSSTADHSSYEPEIHPGATVRLNGKAVLKVFTTGSVTLTGKATAILIDSLSLSRGCYIVRLYPYFRSSTVRRTYQFGSK
jgi:hypothetical protein